MSDKQQNTSTLSELYIHLFNSGLLDDQLFRRNVGLIVDRISFADQQFIVEIYKKIIGVQGVVMEFGCRYGSNLATWINLRGTYEPHNVARKIIGFDTFAGLTGVDKTVDGEHVDASEGSYAVPHGEQYQAILRDVLALHSSLTGVSKERSFDLVVGDVRETVPAYFEENPQTVIALAVLDLDLYHPTVACLEAIKERMPKGSVLAFDELNYKKWPGETQAMMEVFGTNNLRLQKLPFNHHQTFCVVE